VSDQPTLVDVAAEPKLTDRQRFAYESIQASDTGLYADEVGAILHERQGRHHQDQRCEWCARTGLDVLRSKAVAPLVIRRRSGLWQPRQRAEHARPATGVYATSEPDPELNPFADLAAGSDERSNSIGGQR